MTEEKKASFLPILFPLIPLVLLLGLDWIPSISRVLLWILGLGILFSCYSAMVWFNLQYPQSSFLSWGIINLCVFAGAMLSIMGLIILISKYTPAYSDVKNDTMHYYIASSNGKKYALHAYQTDGLFLKKAGEFQCKNQTFEQCVNQNK